MTDLMTIGQFSRMCWLSVKALRLYDQAGLLHPEYVDPETSYRYYSTKQAPVARAIAMMRTLDMPLTDIKELVTESDADKIRARLDAHRALLEDRIDRHHHMLKRVEDFIRKGAVMTYDIKIKDIQPVDVVGLRLTTTPESISRDSSAAMGRLYEALGSEGIAPAAPPRLVYHEMHEDAWKLEACVPVSATSPAPEGLTPRRFSGGKMASALHVGPYDELGMAYRELEVWMDKHDLKRAGPPFDIYLNDPSEVKDPARFETEILWPVG